MGQRIKDYEDQFSENMLKNSEMPRGVPMFLIADHPALSSEIADTVGIHAAA